MTDIQDETEIAEEEEKKKKKKGETDSGAMTQGEAQVTVAAVEHLRSVGASDALINKIYHAWRHLKGEGLLRRIAELMKILVKSSNLEVNINKNEGHSLVHDVIQSAKNNENPALTTKPTHTPDPHTAPKL